MSNETFYPEFSEYVALYRGIENLWVADGTAEKPGTEGFLYAKYVGGTIQELGSIFSYDEAKEIYEEEGKTLTYELWLSLLLHAPEYVAETRILKDRVEEITESIETASIQEVENIFNSVT